MKQNGNRLLLFVRQTKISELVWHKVVHIRVEIVDNQVFECGIRGGRVSSRSRRRGRSGSNWLSVGVRLGRSGVAFRLSRASGRRCRLLGVRVADVVVDLFEETRILRLDVELHHLKATLLLHLEHLEHLLLVVELGLFLVVVGVTVLIAAVLARCVVVSVVLLFGGRSWLAVGYVVQLVSDLVVLQNLDDSFALK